MRGIVKHSLAGLLGLGAIAFVAGLETQFAVAQTFAPPSGSASAATPVTAQPSTMASGADTVSPAKKQAAIAAKPTQSASTGSSRSEKSDGDVKNLPTTSVVSGGKMINPYSEQPETKYIKIPVNSSACPHPPGKPYFVEFRARNAASWGHTFVLYGKLGSGNRFASYKVAGLHPAGDSTQYTLGLWMPVKAETGPSDGDVDEQFLAAKYCVPLTEAEYNKLVPYIKHLQATHSTWLGTGYNCNSFGMDVAKFVGLDAPNPNMHVPQELIKLLAESNKNRQRGPIASNADSSDFFVR